VSVKKAAAGAGIFAIVAASVAAIFGGKKK
jgi:hypothetical protein